MTTATLRLPQAAAPAFSWKEAASALKTGRLSRYLAAVVGEEVEEEQQPDPLALGMNYFSAGQHILAVPTLLLALEADPRQEQARMALIKSLRALDRHAEALKHLDYAIKNHRRAAELHYLTGDSALALGDRATAEKQFRLTIAIDPKHTDGLIRLGILLFEENRHEESITFLNQATFHDRKAAAARYYLAQNCMALGDLKRALNQLHLLQQLAPDYTPTYMSRADIFEALGDHRQVIDELEHLVRLEYVNAEVMYRMANAHHQLGQVDDALPVYLASLQYDPNYVPAIAAAARLSEEKHQFERARELYTRLTRDRRHAPAARAALARVEATLREIENGMVA